MSTELPSSSPMFGDINNLEAAKVALQWTQEKLNSLSNENKELQSKMDAVSSIQKSREQELEALRRTLEERAHHLEDQGVFFEKINATFKMMSEGKMDVNILIQKQLELETLQKRLIEEHQKRLIDLERSQKQIQDRWHERLLELETQYAQRLSLARQNFESLRENQELNNLNHRQSLDEYYKEKAQKIEATREQWRTEHEQDALTLEAVQAQRRAALEQEFERLKTDLYKQLDHERRAYVKGSEEREKILEQSHMAQLAKFEETISKLTMERNVVLERLKESQEAMAGIKARYHEEVVQKINEQEKDYKERLSALAHKEHSLESLYGQRHQELDQSAVDLKRQTEERLHQTQSQAQQMERLLRDNFDRQKTLLDKELSAAIESAQALTRQLHEQEEKYLQESMLKEAQWSKQIQSLKEEKDRAEQESKERVRSLQEEFHQKLQAQQETLEHRSLTLEAQFNEKSLRSEQEYQTLKTKLIAESEDLRASLIVQYEGRLQNLKKDLAHSIEERRALELEMERAEENQMRIHADQQQEIMKKLSTLEVEHKNRLIELERASSQKDAEMKERERRLEAQREEMLQSFEKRRQELDDLERVLLKRLEDLEIAKQEKEKEWHLREEELRQRDQQWRRHRSQLESIYAQKSAKLEDVKEELLKEIQVYKGVKKIKEGVG
ncbi:MAG: hypothetical protein HY547_03820 [Elusimicrobia bacterium]|nr:hypothetical protein [Elusimicrobiota bacterium]